MKCRSGCSSQECEEWLLKEIKTRAREDIYAARAWILTAKHLLPECFSVLFEAYKVELHGNNVEQCGALLSEMFKSFPNEVLLRTELKYSLLTDRGREGVLKNIFQSVSHDVQMTMLEFFAHQQTDIFLRSELTLLLMQRNPDSISQLGLPLVEKLVETEKEIDSGSPLNGYRKLLVCDVLPVICGRITGISHKHFYKWLQKAIEFYVAYLSASQEATSELFGNLQLSWDNLHSLLHHVSAQCEWMELTGLKLSIQDRMNHISDLHRRSRTDISGSISKKQVFYTSISLLLEGAINYAKLLDPLLCQVETPECNKSYVVVCDWGLEALKPSGPDTHTLVSDLKNFFVIARNSWLILQSNETFSKDIHHLYKRWKMDKWTWFQFFLVDNFINEKSYEQAIEKLLDILECNKSRYSITQRCICQLSSLYSTTNQLFQASKFALKCNTIICENSQKLSQSSVYCTASSIGKDLIIFSLTRDHLLQMQVDILTTSLNNIVDGYKDDSLCGHLIVLSQHNWPQKHNLFMQVLDAVSRRSKFVYSVFFDYVVVTDILEEVALLKNTTSCEVILFPSARTGLQRVTRGTGKNASEEFKNSLKRQIRYGEAHCKNLLQKFLVEQQDSILNCFHPRPFEAVIVDSQPG